jgi:tRNA nucleotidyltransferase/poly(A) polymerase
MSKNMQILNAQSDIHNLQCLISLLKKMLTGPEPEISFNEYETEGLLDQLDEALERLNVVSQKLDGMKQAESEFSIISDAEKVVAILAKTRATHKKHGLSKNFRNDSRNGNGHGAVQEIPNMPA